MGFWAFVVLDFSLAGEHNSLRILEIHSYESDCVKGRQQQLDVKIFIFKFLTEHGTRPIIHTKQSPRQNKIIA